MGLNFHWRSGSIDASLEAAFLFLIAHLQPELDQDDPAVHDVFFDFGAKLKEPLIFLRLQKPHHPFDSGPIVPTAVEDDDLASSREVLAYSAACTSATFLGPKAPVVRPNGRHAG